MCGCPIIWVIYRYAEVGADICRHGQRISINRKRGSVRATISLSVIADCVGAEHRVR